MGVECIKWTGIILIIAYVQGQNFTDSYVEKRLELTNKHSDWDTTSQTCEVLAGKEVFCTADDNDCFPDVRGYDTSRLPDEFKAWIDSYLSESYTVTFKGCYKDFNDEFFEERKGITDLRSCILSCPDEYEYVGVKNDSCYCILDLQFSYLSVTSIQLISTHLCQEDMLDTNEMWINTYKRQRDFFLMFDVCHAAYYFGGSSWTFYVAKCTEKHKYICNNSYTEDVESTWLNATETCDGMSSRLLFEPEIQKQKISNNTPGVYWINGFHIRHFAFEGFKPDNTRCTALERDDTGNLKFSVLDCSVELPALCVKNDSETLTTHPGLFPFVSKPVTTEGSSSKTSENETSTESTQLPDAPFTQNDQGKNMSPSTETNIGQDKSPVNRKDGHTGVIIGSVFVCVLAVVIVVACFVIYRRKRNEATQRWEKYNSRREKGNFKTDNGDAQSSQLVEHQTLCYLPVSMKYPSVYNEVDVATVENSKSGHKDSYIIIHSEDDPSSRVDDTSMDTEETKSEDLDDGNQKTDENDDEDKNVSESVDHSDDANQNDKKRLSYGVEDDAALIDSEENILVLRKTSANYNTNSKSNVTKTGEYVSIRMTVNSDGTDDDDDKYVSMRNFSQDDLTNFQKMHSEDTTPLIGEKEGSDVNKVVKIENLDFRKSPNSMLGTSLTDINNGADISILRELINSSNSENETRSTLTDTRIDSIVFRMSDEY